MIIQLKSDNKTIEFISGSWELNQNDDFVQSLNVIPEIPLDYREKLLVLFKSEEAGRTYTIELLSKGEVYSIDIPNALLEAGGEFTIQLIRRRYDTNGTNYIDIGSFPYTATVGEGVTNLAGQNVTVAMITTLYRAVEEAINDTVPFIVQKAQEAATSATDSKDAADRAEQAANRAEDRAGAAAESAESAIQAAIQANGVAAEAKGIAESAVGIANLAQNHATDAETTAQSAKSLAENANTNSATALNVAGTKVNRSGDTMYGALEIINPTLQDGVEHRANIHPIDDKTTFSAESINTSNGKSIQTTYGSNGMVHKEWDGKKIELHFPENGGTISTEDKSREIAQEEIAKFDFIKIVAELPETGLPNRFYLVPKTDGSSTDLFDAWTWVNKGTEEEPAYDWEYEGTKSAEFDPTLFVKFTDYAGSNNQLGVVSLNATFGITAYINSLYKNTLSIQPATEAQIDTHKNGISADLYHPIVPARLQYAVKKGLTENELELTDEEKNAFYAWISAVQYYSEARNGIARYINGNLIVNTPTADSHATTKKYIDNLPDYLTLTDDERAKWLSMLGAGGSKMYSHNFLCYFKESYVYQDRDYCAVQFRMILSKDTAFTSLEELVAYLTAKGAINGNTAIMATGESWVTTDEIGMSLVHGVQGVYAKDNTVQVKLFINDINFFGTPVTLTELRNAYCTEV